MKNAGERAGAEVVQLYVEDRASKADRPLRELKGFEKVYLEPGEEQRVRLFLDVHDLAYFDDDADAWTHAPGEYGVHVGRSYADIRLSGSMIAG